MSMPKDKAEKYLNKDPCQSPPNTPRPITPPPLIFNALKTPKEPVLTVDADGVDILQKNIKYAQSQKLKASSPKPQPIKTKLIEIQSKK